MQYDYAGGPNVIMRGAGEELQKGLEDRRGPQAKKGGKFLEARKGKKMEAPLDP